MVDYYVDSLQGLDTNTGLFGSSWKSIQRVNQAIADATVKRGDRVMFRRGRRYYGNLDTTTLSTANQSQLTIRSWNGGPLPILDAYKVSLDAWEDSGNGVWRLNIAANSPAISGNVTSTGVDVGHLCVNGVVYGDKKQSTATLVNEWDFYSNATEGYVYVRKATSPGAGIEIAVRGNNVTYGNTVDFTELYVRGAGAHGFDGSARSTFNIYGNVIENVGGSFQPGNTVRYGNGIQGYLDSRQFNITGNRIRQAYDSGITLQGPVNGVAVVDGIISNNYISDCGQSIEFWVTTTTPAQASMNRIRVKENVCVDAGYSFGSLVRPDKTGKGVHVLTYGLEGVVDLIIERNVFYGARDTFFYYELPYKNVVNIRNNTVILPHGTRLSYRRNKANESTSGYDPETVDAPGSNRFVTSSQVVGYYNTIDPASPQAVSMMLEAVAAQTLFNTLVAQFWTPTAAA